MKKLIIILFLFIFTGQLYAQTENANDSIIHKEFQLLEAKLSYLKKNIFISFLYDLKQAYYEKNNISVTTKDSICYQELYILDYSDVIGFSIGESAFVSIVTNTPDGKLGYQNLLDKWLQKDYLDYYKMAIGDAITLDDEYNKKGDVLMLKALEFYESEDLEKYIDWIRQIVRNEIIEEYKTHQN